MTYAFTARSPSDPNGGKGGLGFSTEALAQEHTDRMNRAIDDYPNGYWNVDHWKTIPEPWQVFAS